MIEFLLFFITACVPDGDGYVCNVLIYIYDKQGILDQYWINEGNELPKNGPLRGMHSYFYHYDMHVIRVLSSTIDEWAYYGCNVLWHELLHARGVFEKDIPMCKWRP